MPDVNIIPTPLAYDDTGTLAENFIVNEQRTTPAMNVRALAPRFGAFYTGTFAIRDANGNPLAKTQYQFGLFKPSLADMTGKDCAAAVVVTDANALSPFYIDYHAVGGPWGASNEHIIELFAQLNNDQRPVTWPNILGKPDGFKPAPHLQDIGSLFGAEYFVNAMERLAEAYLMGDNASHDEIFRLIDQNKQDITNQLNQLNSSLRAYIDQQDGKLQTEIDQFSTQLTNLQNSLQQQITAVSQQVTALQQNIQPQIDNLTQTLNNHINAKGNVHQATPGDIGAYSKPEVDQMIAAINNNLGNFVKKNAQEDTSLLVQNGQLWSWVQGGWRIVWPPQWQ